MLSTLWKSLIVRLLHLANADNHGVLRTDFYALKQRLCERYGRCRGHDIQVIRKECWGTNWDDRGFDDDGHIPCGPTCRRCGGTGIFDIRWVCLERWEVGKYTFHRPIDSTRRQPEGDPARWIQGRIDHPHYGLKSAEARLWLYLLCGEFRLLWRAMKSSSYCYPRFWPMLNLQRIVMNTAMKLHRKKCWCGKRFFTWGSGWQICKKCRTRKSAEAIPF